VEDEGWKKWKVEDEYEGEDEQGCKVRLIIVMVVRLE
jgi:hypothetical protein